MGSEEIVFLAYAGIDVAHHHEETGVLEVEIGIDVDDRAVADLHLAVVGLYGVLSDARHIFRCVVLGEVAEVTT